MLTSGLNDLKLARLSPIHQKKIHTFLSSIFNVEQNIPVEMIPINSNKIYWWGIIGLNQEILGVAATWLEKDNWHWGRFSIHPKIRGRGLGRKLAMVSLIETFELDIEYVTIEAREATIALIEKFGGTICGKTTHFFSENITPMKLERKKFNPTNK
ncbi:GNAT family N-acetyltransferase [Mangrovivirga sp. M17]|uniref:GNAT family N-acetyltransferase n=1 Tax=Mangrovivirga halotolerans TaxID=2993936 RepID=A0ABT3RVC9_9BACT|nr:GNAT family N-acetyltransferase [Mangrovivirga halotolerans]MCX2745621.1 GNAT family N-acetyltransferase [Mangrovivirga halotolerans]